MFFFGPDSFRESADLRCIMLGGTRWFAQDENSTASTRLVTMTMTLLERFQRPFSAATLVLMNPSIARAEFWADAGAGFGRLLGASRRRLMARRNHGRSQ